MFMMVQLYDGVGHWHARVHCVEDSPGGQAMSTLMHVNWIIPEAPEPQTARDVLAMLGEELIGLAHSETPLL